MRTSFEPQSVLYQFPVSRNLASLLYTRLLCCTHPDCDAPYQRDTCDRSTFKGSERHQRFLFDREKVWKCFCSFVETFVCSESFFLIS